MGSFFGGGGGSAYDTSGLEDAQREATALQRKMYEETVERQAPWYETGGAGIGRLGTLLGLDGETGDEEYGSLLEAFGPEQFQEDPGYRFRQDEEQKALQRQMAAQGVTLGGGGFGEINPQVARALQEQSQGLASQEYGSAYNRYNLDQQNIFNRLMGVAGMGQSSAGMVDTAGQNYATNVGNLTTSLASAQAQAAQAAASQPSMFNQLLDVGATLGAAYLSDERLKENIKHVGNKKGHNIYEFNYKDKPDVRYRGVMAQEVRDINPSAVVEEDNGFLAVYYDKIGLKMECV